MKLVTRHGTPITHMVNDSQYISALNEDEPVRENRHGKLEYNWDLQGGNLDDETIFDATRYGELLFLDEDGEYRLAGDAIIILEDGTEVPYPVTPPTFRSKADAIITIAKWLNDLPHDSHLSSDELQRVAQRTWQLARSNQVDVDVQTLLDTVNRTREEG